MEGRICHLYYSCYPPPSPPFRFCVSQFLLSTLSFPIFSCLFASLSFDKGAGGGGREEGREETTSPVFFPEICDWFFFPLFFSWWNRSSCKFRDQHTISSSCPTTNGGTQNGSSVGICTHCIRVLARSAPICNAQWVLINKISASELSRNFIKSALLVGSCSNSSSGFFKTPLLCCGGKSECNPSPSFSARNHKVSSQRLVEHVHPPFFVF